MEEGNSLEILVVEDGKFNEAVKAANNVNDKYSDVNVSAVKTASEAYKLISSGSKIDFLLTDMLFEEELKDEELRNKYLQVCDMARNYAEANYVPYTSDPEKRSLLDRKMREGKISRGEIEKWVAYYGNKVSGLKILAEQLKDEEKNAKKKIESLSYPYEDEAQKAEVEELYNQLMEEFNVKTQYALGNVLFLEASKRNIQACIFTSTHRHDAFIDGTYLVAPLAAKGFLTYSEYDPEGDVCDMSVDSFDKGKLPILVLDALKSVSSYEWSLNTIIECLRKKK